MRFKFLPVLISPLIFVFFSCAKEVPVKPDLKGMLIAIAQKNHIPTLSVLVKSQKINLNFQYRNDDKGIEPVGNYGVASTTKFLSAVLILKKIEEQKIGLNDPIQNYVDGSGFENIPWFKSITVKHLLNHTSGIPDYTKNPEWINLVMKGTPPETYEQKIALVNKSVQTAHFGSHVYSNTNYIILEKIIETISNKKNSRMVFNDFYAGLSIRGISFPDSQDGNQAFFAQAENSIANVSAWQEDYGFDGGAFCRTKDLSTILENVFLKKTVLNQSSLDLLTSWTDAGEYKINYGFARMTDYGLGLMKYMVNGRTFLGHAGSSLKYQSFAFIEPSTGTEIILQTNCSGRYYNNTFFIDLVKEAIKATE